MGHLQTAALAQLAAHADTTNGASFVENRTFDEIQLDDSASISRILTEEDVKLFAIISGDENPTHIDEEYAKTTGLHGLAGHGMWGAILISAVLGNQLPGPGTVYRSQTIHFARQVAVGDSVTITVRVTAKTEEDKIIKFACQAVNQNGDVILEGDAEVVAPTVKIKRPRVLLPEVRIADKSSGYQKLIKKTEGLEAIRTAVVHPTDSASLLGAIEAAKAGLIIPILIGPESKIRAVADAEHIDLSQYELISTEHSHAAAEEAVRLVRVGQAECIMKGSLHTDELMREVVGKNGLRTARRISHVFVMDVPTYPRNLLITDAAVNIAPSLLDKADILQNAIELSHVLGVELPRAAILSAVETVTPDIESTIEAAALCKMADRRQIVGALVDGPLAFDNAISEAAAKTKGITSPVAGRADILLVPDLEAGNMLAKQLEYLADARSAGIVLGARVPIILTSRADTVLTRLASSAVAVLLAHDRRKKLGIKPLTQD